MRRKNSVGQDEKTFVYVCTSIFKLKECKINDSYNALDSMQKSAIKLTDSFFLSPGGIIKPNSSSDNVRVQLEQIFLLTPLYNSLGV